MALGGMKLFNAEGVERCVALKWTEIRPAEQCRPVCIRVAAAASLPLHQPVLCPTRRQDVTSASCQLRKEVVRGQFCAGVNVM